eukprot:NODE_752_length_4215_cov_0.325559.p2 type:complete len:315 gc:universal NODE_752_length_4215_cov_0.325559:3474-2530(-)
MFYLLFLLNAVLTNDEKTQLTLKCVDLDSTFLVSLTENQLMTFDNGLRMEFIAKNNRYFLTSTFITDHRAFVLKKSRLGAFAAYKRVDWPQPAFIQPYHGYFDSNDESISPLMELSNQLSCRVFQDVEFEMSCWVGSQENRQFMQTKIRSNHAAVSIYNQRVSLRCADKCVFNVDDKTVQRADDEKYFGFAYGDLYCRRSRENDNVKTKLSRLELTLSDIKEPFTLIDGNIEQFENGLELYLENKEGIIVLVIRYRNAIQEIGLMHNRASDGYQFSQNIRVKVEQMQNNRKKSLVSLYNNPDTNTGMIEVTLQV